VEFGGAILTGTKLPALFGASETFPVSATG
jgi:hypothetical protein